MSLIVCSECGKEISDKASICIHCGNPIYKDEHTNVVLVERSWIDLSDKEKISLVCEYERKTGFNMHFTFGECTFWCNLVVYFGFLILVPSMVGMVVGLDDEAFIASGVFLLSVLWVCVFSFLSYNTRQKYKGEINWNK